MTYYRYNKQLFRAPDPHTPDNAFGVLKYEIYHQGKQQWQTCMIFQAAQLKNAVDKGKIYPISEENVFLEIL
jgi:hypothetical protein